MNKFKKGDLVRTTDFVYVIKRAHETGKVTVTQLMRISKGVLGNNKTYKYTQSSTFRPIDLETHLKLLKAFKSFKGDANV